jgi:hypothetical protein
VKDNELIKLDNLSSFVSNIGNHLVKNQDILKLLKWNTKNALTTADLGIPDIVALMGRGSDPSKDKRIFKQPFHNEIANEMRSEIRFFIPQINPNNIYIAGVDICFQVIVHNNLWDLDGNLDRPLVMVNRLLNHFNGQDVGGIGELKLISPIKMYAYSDNFSGYTFVLSTRMV